MRDRVVRTSNSLATWAVQQCISGSLAYFEQHQYQIEEIRPLSSDGYSCQRHAGEKLAI